jgi:hypothetical protein
VSIGSHRTDIVVKADFVADCSVHHGGSCETIIGDIDGRLVARCDSQDEREIFRLGSRHNSVDGTVLDRVGPGIARIGSRIHAADHFIGSVAGALQHVVDQFFGWKNDRHEISVPLLQVQFL